MKQGTKFKINILPVLGIIGLLFVILYFLLANLSGDPGDQTPQKDPYYLFRKLYQKLGYQLAVRHPQNLPRPRAGDMMIYLNYNETEREAGSAPIRGKERKARPAVFIERWLRRGGVVLIAGIQGNRDPFSSAKVRTSLIKTITIDGSYAEPNRARIKPLPMFQRNYLRHFTLNHDLSKEKIILDSKAGPLLYKSVKGGGAIFVLSDSALLTNEYLRDDNTAVFFNQLLKPYFGERIYLVREDLPSGQKTIPILALLFQDKLLFISLQMLWMIGLFYAWQGKRFGAPQPLDPYARRTLSEHLKAIGYFYQKTNSLGIVDEINCDYFKHMIQKITGFQWKDPPRPEDLEKVKKYTGSGDFTKEQIMECLKKDPNITASRLHHKGKLQDRIIKSLKKE